MYEDVPVAKLSTAKTTRPGSKQVWRLPDWSADVVALREEEGPAGADPLLAEVMSWASDREPRPGRSRPRSSNASWRRCPKASGRWIRASTGSRAPGAGVAGPGVSASIRARELGD